MPFDCTPVIDPPKQCSVIGGNCVETRILCRAAPTRSSPIPNWYLRREAVDTATAVLTRAREIISDERRWCKGTLARGWFDVPVSVQSRFARRFCAMGAIERCGRELGVTTENAVSAGGAQRFRA